ncbi:MAG: sulfatase-like hydrolase/transferase, partial [Chitinophagales bacterium]|nr:sulfatase-like hydrolase/transferase [Chitinophagales bacterium]
MPCLKTFVLALLFGLPFPLFSQDSKPNIILIVLDDLNDYTGFLGGHPQVHTPNMDLLAAESIVFENAFCSTPICGPSRISFLTGKDAFYTQVYNNAEVEPVFRDHFSDETGNGTVFTLPEYLKSNQYFTVSIDKVFHSGNSDFDSITPDACEKEYSWNKLIKLSTSASVSDTFNDGFEPEGLQWGILPDSLERDLKDVKAIDSAINIIEQYASGEMETCDKNLFLAVGISKPHSPMIVPNSYFLPYYIDDFFADPYLIPYNHPADTFPFNGVVMPPQPDIMWGDYYALPDTGVAYNFTRKYYTEFLNFTDELPFFPEIDTGLTDSTRAFILQESKRANMVMAYLASISFADFHIGRLLHALKSDPELYHNTIIVIIG